VEIDNRWTEILYQMAGNSPVEYDSLKSKDVFEFFRILRVHQKTISSKNAGGSTKNNRR
jgi:hypothetical protein